MIRLESHKIAPTFFPDKTSQVWKIPQTLLNEHSATIYWDYENESELIHIAQLKDLLDQNEVKAVLEISYLPYARQDKEISNESTFALKTFSKILNCLQFDTVFISDPHSKTATDLIQNSVAQYNALPNIKHDILCYPDKGAVLKYSVLYKTDYAYGEKVRDQLSGNILNYALFGNVKNKSVLIVDDICDGGATFIFLTKALLEAEAKEVNLFVSHGLFTKGIKILKDAGINRIFTKQGEII